MQIEIEEKTHPDNVNIKILKGTTARNKAILKKFKHDDKRLDKINYNEVIESIRGKINQRDRYKIMFLIHGEGWRDTGKMWKGNELDSEFIGFDHEQESASVGNWMNKIVQFNVIRI